MYTYVVILHMCAELDLNADQKSRHERIVLLIPKFISWYSMLVKFGLVRYFLARR